MGEKHQSFTELVVWQRARAFKNEIRALTKTFPTEEQFRFANQLIRSSRSIGAALAEGHGRYTYPDQLRFCIIARGSLTETLHHLTDALDEQLMTQERFDTFQIEYNQLLALLNGYIRYLRQKQHEDRTDISQQKNYPHNQENQNLEF